MTKDVIANLCKANGGYQIPRLNDQLFLHCKGFMRIQNLDEYIHVKVLWVEQNAISELDGIDKLQELVSLFAQNNTIRSLRNMSGPMMNLRVLNVSHNYLTSLEGIARACPQLETLQASHNHITTLDACKELWELAETLTSVDLSFNRLEREKDTATHNAVPAAEPAPRAAPTHAEERPVVEPCTKNTCAHDVLEQGVRNIVNDDIRVIEPVRCSSAATAAPAVIDVIEASRHVTSNRDEPAAAHEQPCTATDSATATAATTHPAYASAEHANPLIDFFQHLPHVSVIYLHGNALTHGMKNYRRQMILHLPALTYLDERPVFAEERRVTEAWGRGGQNRENAEREAIRAEKRQHLESCVRVLTDRMESHCATRDRLTREWQLRQQRETEEYTLWRRAQKEAVLAVAREEDDARTALTQLEEDAWVDVRDDAAQEHAQLMVGEAERMRDMKIRNEVAQVRSQVLEELTAAKATELVSDDDTIDMPTTAADSPCKAATTEPQESTMAQEEDQTRAIQQLIRTDSDILHEMESEMESVLTNINSSVATHMHRAPGGDVAQTVCAQCAPSASPEHGEHTTCTTHSSMSHDKSECASAPDTVADDDTRTRAAYVDAMQLSFLPDQATIHAERSLHSTIASVSRRLSSDRSRKTHSQDKLYEQFHQWEKKRTCLPGA